MNRCLCLIATALFAVSAFAQEARVTPTIIYPGMRAKAVKPDCIKGNACERSAFYVQDVWYKNGYVRQYLPYAAKSVSSGVAAENGTAMQTHSKRD